jgi:hypothetical protein
MTKIEMKEIRKALTTPGTRFMIVNNPMLTTKIFTVGDGFVSGGILDQMNVEYVGATKMDLYTYSMMCTKVKATIFFEDVTIIKE